MKTANITISNRRKNGATDDSLIFSTRVRRGRLIFIPFTLISAKEDNKIKISDTHSEPAITYTIPLWKFNKIESYLKNMGDDYRLEK